MNAEDDKSISDRTACLAGAREAAWGCTEPRAAELWSLAVFQPQGSIVTDWGLVCAHELAWICVCAHMCTLIGAWQAYAYCGVEEGEQAVAPVHTQCCDHAFFPE